MIAIIFKPLTLGVIFYASRTGASAASSSPPNSSILWISGSCDSYFPARVLISSYLNSLPWVRHSCHFFKEPEYLQSTPPHRVSPKPASVLPIFSSPQHASVLFLPRKLPPPKSPKFCHQKTGWFSGWAKKALGVSIKRGKNIVKKKMIPFHWNLHILLASFASREWTFVMSYMVVLVGGMKFECISKRLKTTLNASFEK